MAQIGPGLGRDTSISKKQGVSTLLRLAVYCCDEELLGASVLCPHKWVTELDNGVAI